MNTLSDLQKYSDGIPKQGKKMPILFTSHGNPMDIPLSREDRPFWMKLYHLGKDLKEHYDVKAALVISAHWCTNNITMVNNAVQQEQIYDYYGFPEHFYDPKYYAQGAPKIAEEIASLVTTIKATDDWGLDHGAWPMLMHLFPAADVPVFQMSINYNANPEYHYHLGQQLKALREKGVLVIGSGSLIHNLSLAMKKMRLGDTSIYGWEPEYDHWLKEQIEQRNVRNLTDYHTSHKYGKLASPTPDHYVPILYSLGMMDNNDRIEFFYEGAPSLPAFSERSFILRPEHS
jgi:4,5-DOPA dioxygenase extradiol